jgi:hypothetical protein
MEKPMRRPGAMPKAAAVAREPAAVAGMVATLSRWDPAPSQLVGKVVIRMEEMLKRLERLEAERATLIEFFAGLASDPFVDRRLREKFDQLVKAMTNAEK